MGGGGAVSTLSDELRKQAQIQGKGGTGKVYKHRDSTTKHSQHELQAFTKRGEKGEWVG